MLNPLTLLRMAPYIAIALLLAWGMRVNHLRDRWHHQYVAEHAGRLQDRATYEQAQKDAAAQNKAHVADVEAQQKRISDERLKDANDRLSRLADELRKHGPAAQGHPNGAGPSPVPGTAPGASSAPGLCLSPEQLLRAAADEERHAQLIRWIEEQLKIDPNK
jgi:hypothetical protein